MSEGAAIEFCRWAVREMMNGFGDLDGGSVWDKMIELGLIVPVPGGYDPDKHGPDHHGDGLPGQDWYVWADWLLKPSNVVLTGSGEPLNPSQAAGSVAKPAPSVNE